MAPNLYALLVGIDRYDNPAQAPHLRGCVADVEGTYRWLTEQMDVPEGNVLLLTSRMDGSEAPELRSTRDNIIRGWQEHLTKAGSGDQVFFNYSGHGAQARSIAPENASGYDETMVPCDSRTPGVFDILDKELAQLIEAVEKRGAQVTVFLDCCHSGSGTRAVHPDDENAPRVRKCSVDERERPMATVVAGVAENLKASTRSVKAPSGWVPLGKHVLLAGCRDEELSHEYRAPETGQWQGATTYFFHKAMANFRPGMTWSDVHDFIQTHVHKVYPAQSPQLEGPGNMEIFGGVGNEVKRYLLVTEVDGQDFIMLNAGVTAGLNPGAKVSVFPPSSDLSGEPVATAIVDDVKVDHAWARLDQSMAIAPASRVKITSFGLDDQALIVTVDSDELRQAIGESNSAFLQLADASNKAGTAQYRVDTRDGRYIITDASGAQVVEEKPTAGAEGAAKVAKLLEHIGIFNNIAALRNPSSFSAMAGAVSIEDLSTYTQLSARRMPRDPQPLRTRESGNEASIKSGDRIFFNVRNNTDGDLYLAIFELTPDFGVSKIYPTRAQYQRVAARKDIPIPLVVTLDNPTLAKGRDIFKVVASSEPTEFGMLELPELNKGDTRSGTRSVGGSSLSKLMNAVRHDGTRAASLDVDETDDQWTTAQVEITIIADEQGAELVAGDTKAEVNTTFLPITVNKPASLSGTLSIGPAEQSTRNIGGGAQPPPGMDNPDAAQYFELMTLGAGTRAAGESPLLLTVESEEEQLASVTPDTPMQVELAVDDDPALRGIIPIGFDGENYYVVGSSEEGTSSDAPGTRSVGSGQRTMRVNIGFLPPEGASQSTEPADPTQTRDLKRTARLLFYKVFLKELPEDTGLRKAELSNGKAIYSSVSSNDVAGVKKVALVIHGLTADTVWLVEKVWPIVQPIEEYDLCLAYDYETFGTGIKENGRILHEALTSIGFGANKNIKLDIYSHSMGTLVSRAVVELWGGDAYVDRVFMGGPPNAGSPLAKLSGYVPWLGTLMINQMGAIPASMLLGWSLKQFGRIGAGLADLDPDAEFYKELNIAKKTPVTVPYFIQIGDNARAYERWDNIFRLGMRLADTALENLFGGDHDLAVGVDSARAVQQELWPNATVEVIGSNHFGYFYPPEGRSILEKWLNGDV